MKEINFQGVNLIFGGLGNNASEANRKAKESYEEAKDFIVGFLEGFVSAF